MRSRVLSSANSWISVESAYGTTLEAGNTQAVLHSVRPASRSLILTWRESRYISPQPFPGLRGESCSYKLSWAIDVIAKQLKGLLQRPTRLRRVPQPPFAALPEILSDGGYHTILSGKWHLGLTKQFAPRSRGFKKNFTFLPGSRNHHAYEPQLDNADGWFSALCTDGHWMEGDTFLDHRTDLPEDFFSTVTFTDKLLDFFKTRIYEEKEQHFLCLPAVHSSALAFKSL
ncbi:sulfatase [Fusarium albosuccineum]|uniref:Sulfatase n=1 Tax=Fusarium albosuccineum TaxID=1237068 RepID=A0A8H4KZV1_9HYPO|nr:sulfatase [Fusarium albosuccineum]